MNEDTKRVLVVDDEEGFRFFLKTGLERQGYEVRQADHVAAGIAEARRFRPTAALVDLKMPDGSGLEVMRELLRELDPPPVVILMTAYATIPTAIQAIREGAAEFLTKPFELDEALTVLDKALEGERLRLENVRLKTLLDERTSYAGLIGASPSMRALYADIERIAAADGTVLLSGESGTGKELVARAIHDRSARKDGPFLPVHCAALPEALIESELFGHTEGAFTGAQRAKVGAFERAEGGTLFLDEVSEIPLSIQVKLLRAIQEGEVTPLGAGETRRVDVRWIAATNRDLAAGVEAGEFREDLYFRLDVLRVRVPPLRDRAGDVTLLVDRLLEKKFARTERPAPTVQPQARRALESYPWPGNVRELENLTERLAALHRGDKIELGDLPEGIRELGTPEGFPAFAAAREAFERRYLLDLLQESSGHMTRAASIAGLSRQALYAKIGAYGIDPERFRDGSRRTPLEGGD